MAWTAPRTWVTSEVVTASHMNTHVRDNLLETAPGKASAAGLVLATAANSITVRARGENSVTTLESTSSSSFTDLATNGPDLLLDTGSVVLVIVSARMSSTTAGCRPSVGVEVSGDTSVSAAFNRCLQAEVSNASDVYQASYAYSYSAITPGTNGFNLKYADEAAAGTATFSQRRITVIPLN